MKRFSEYWTTIFLVVGALFIVAGDQLSQPIAFTMAVFCFGLSALAEGCWLIIYRQGTLVHVQSGKAQYADLAAQLWGVLLVAIACLLLMVGIAGLVVRGGAGVFWSSFINKPYGWGILLMGVGGAFGIYGGIRLLENVAWKPTDLSSRLHVTGELVKGGFFVFISLLLVCIGVGLLVAPQLLRNLANTFVQALLRLLSGALL